MLARLRDRLRTCLVPVLVSAVCAGVSPASMGAAMLAPEPNAVPTDWQFDVEVGPLRVVNLRMGNGSRQAFYYLTYQVVNDTGKDLFFAPLIELATDQGEVMLAGRGVPLDATFEIIDRQRNILLEDPIRVLGRLQQGEENARDGIAIWPVGKTDIDSVQVYLMGFSGETKAVRTRDAATGDPKVVTLWKTLMLRHAVRGDLLNSDAFSEGGRALERTQARWILRKPEAIVTTTVQTGTTSPDGRTSP